MNPALLDTDTLSEVLKRRDQIVLANARAYLAQHGQFTFSAVTRYEIRRGAPEPQGDHSPSAI
jgi:tRNA(fMet)-specific endonuclease VapC